MDQGPTVPPVTRAAAEARAPAVAKEVAAVEAARTRLGDDLDRLSKELRTDMSETGEKIAYKIASALIGVAAGAVVKKAISAVWSATRGNPPEDGDLSTGLGDALGWAIATGVGAGIVKVLAERGAAKGWEKALGHAPPR